VEAKAAIRNVLNILFGGGEPMANKRFLRTVMNATPVILSQFTARNIHGVIKLVSLFVRTNNPYASVGQIKFQFFQATMLLKGNIPNNGHIDRFTTLPTGMAFSCPFHRHIPPKTPGRKTV
jgi:hypothetical protein